MGWESETIGLHLDIGILPPHFFTNPNNNSLSIKIIANEMLFAMIRNRDKITSPTHLIKSSQRSMVSLRAFGFMGLDI